MDDLTCPNCGNPVSASAAFCQSCGERLRKPEVSAGQRETSGVALPTQAGLCSRCGTQHQPPFPSHCQACGYPLAGPRVQSAPGPAPRPHPIPPRVPPPPLPGAGAPTMSQPAKSARTEKPKWASRRIFGIVAGVAVLAGVIAILLHPGEVIVDDVGVEPCQPVSAGEDFEAANPRDLQGNLRQNTYFRGGEEYTIAEDATLTVPDGITLIIEPGVRVRFGQGARMVVEGTLLACGRSNRRILFTANTTTGQPGYWAGIEFRSADPETVIGYANFEFAGRDKHAPVWVEATDLQLEDVKFSGNQWYSLSLDPDSFPRLRSPFVVENGPIGWEVRGGVLSKDRKWAGEQPFIVNGVLEVGEKATLTLLPGTWVKFQPDSALKVIGKLDAQGATNEHVIFTSVNDSAEENAPEPAEGDWVGLQFVGRNAKSRLAFVEIRYAGAEARERGCLWLSDAAPELRNVTISDCAGFSLSSDLPSDPTIENLTLAETEPLRRWELRESKLERVTSRRLSKLSTTDHAPLYPVLTGWVGISPEASLTIDPGVILLFAGGDRSGFWVDGALKAEGSREEPIVFTSWRDPQFNPAGGAWPGDWGGVHLKNNSPGKISLSQVEIRFAGAVENTCLWLRPASPKISNLKVSDCAGYPVSSDAASRPQVEGLDLGENDRHANRWEIRQSSLEAREEWNWVALSGVDGTPVIREITGIVTVGREATLRLAPGLILKFTNGAGLAAQGSLLAEGTVENPILFTSWRDAEGGGDESGAQPGDWAGVFLDGSQTTKKLIFVQIRYAGLADRRVSCLSLQGAAPTLKSVTITGCGYYPIGSDLAAEPSIESLTLSDNRPADEWAIWESTLAKGLQRTWRALSQADGSRRIVRVASGWLTIEKTAELSLQEGVVLKFGRGTGLRVQGALSAEGNADAPVVLTSWRDPEFSLDTGVQTGDWVGVVLENVQSDTRLSHVEVRYAGGESNPRGALILTDSRPILSEVTIRDSAWYPISIDVKSAPQIGRLTLSDNSTANAVEVRSSTLDVVGETVWSPWYDADNRPIVRVVRDRLRINHEATLRLDQDTIIKFDTNGGLDVYGGLLTAQAVLTSLHDDEYGGDTDGGTSGERSWLGVQLHGRQLTRLDGTLIRYAQTGVWLEDAGPLIDNSRIEDSRLAALSADVRSSPEIGNLTMARNAINGMVIRETALPEGETRWRVIGAPESQVVRVLRNVLVIGPNSRLSIDPGVVIKFSSQAGLVVEGELRVGEPDGAQVSFTALAHDAVAGDTDNASQIPNRGAWLGIVVNPNDTNARLALFNTEIRFATIGLYLTHMPEWEFKGLTISDSQLYGLSCDALSLFLSGESEITLINNGAETLSCPTPDRRGGTP